MSQTAYSVNLPTISRGGQLNDSGFTDKISVPCALAIPYGTMVVRDSADISGKAPAAASDITTISNMMGVALAPGAIESDPNVVGSKYPAKSVVPCLRKGRVWVQVEEDVTVASVVYVRYAAGGNGVGCFGDSAGTSEKAAMPATNGKYLTGALANAYALLEINL